jgi:hypothetical protein
MNEKSLRTRGVGAIEDLCELAERLGYRGWFQKLTLKNGASVTSLLNLLENNPELVQTMYDWIHKNYKINLEEKD